MRVNGSNIDSLWILRFDSTDLFFVHRFSPPDYACHRQNSRKSGDKFVFTVEADVADILIAI